MSNRIDPETKSWWWMIAHERDGWASTTKITRFIAFWVVTGIIIFVTYTKTVPPGLEGLLAIYGVYAIAQRAASQWSWTKEKNDGGSRTSSELDAQ